MFYANTEQIEEEEENCGIRETRKRGDRTTKARLCLALPKVTGGVGVDAEGICQKDEVKKP